MQWREIGGSGGSRRRRGARHWLGAGTARGEDQAPAFDWLRWPNSSPQPARPPPPSRPPPLRRPARPRLRSSLPAAQPGGGHSDPPRFFFPPPFPRTAPSPQPFLCAGPFSARTCPNTLLLFASSPPRPKDLQLRACGTLCVTLGVQSRSVRRTF